VLLAAWLVVPAILAVVIAVGRFFAASRRYADRFMDGVAARFGGTRARRVVTFTQDGVAWEFQYSPGTHHRRSWVELRRPSAARSAWSAGRAGTLSWLSGGTQVTTGDEAFDRDLEVRAEDVIAAGAFFADGARRAAVRRLLAAGAAAVDQDEAELTVRWSPVVRAADLDAVDPPAAMDSMRALAGPAPAPPVLAAARARPARRIPAQMAVMLAVIAFVVLAGLAEDIYQPLDDTRVWTDTLVWSVPLAAMAALGLWRAGSRVTRRQRETAPWIGACLLVPLAARGAAIAVNGGLDWGTPSAHVARVVGAAVEGRRAHLLLVGSWRRSGTERIRVPEGVFDAVRAGSRVTVVTRPGRLGYEWIVSCEPTAARS